MGMPCSRSVPQCCWAVVRPLTACFPGAPACADPVEDIEEASFILQAYEDDWLSAIEQGRPSFRALQGFRGPWAFVLFDRRWGRRGFPGLGALRRALHLPGLVSGLAWACLTGWCPSRDRALPGAGILFSMWVERGPPRWTAWAAPSADAPRSPPHSRRSCHRIIAGRDPGGEESLYWGSALLSDGLLLASDLCARGRAREGGGSGAGVRAGRVIRRAHAPTRAGPLPTQRPSDFRRPRRNLIEADTANAEAFPPGMIFVSHEEDTAGQLIPVTAPSRPPSAAELCRVESTGDMGSMSVHKVASQPQLSTA